MKLHYTPAIMVTRPCSADPIIFWADRVIIITADALSTFIDRISAGIKWTSFIHAKSSEWFSILNTLVDLNFLKYIHSWNTSIRCQMVIYNIVENFLSVPMHDVSSIFRLHSKHCQKSNSLDMMPTRRFDEIVYDNEINILHQMPKYNFSILQVKKWEWKTQWIFLILRNLAAEMLLNLVSQNYLQDYIIRWLLNLMDTL